MAERTENNLAESRNHQGQDLAAQIIEVLRGLARHQVVHWHDPPVFEKELHLGHVDIWAPIVCNSLGIGWAWTIDRNRQEPPGLSLDIMIDPDEIVDGQPAWRSETINRALERWVAEHAQRPDIRFAADTSLVSPIDLRLEEALNEAKTDPRRHAVDDLEALEDDPEP